MSNRSAFLVALIVIVVLVLVVHTRRRFEQYLSGHWAADPEFLTRAKLNDMQMSISEGKGTRDGYLLMTDLDGNFLVNQAVQLKIMHPWRSALRGSLEGLTRDSYSARCRVDSPVLPPRMQIELSMRDGTLVLRDRKKIYAFLLKDHLASAVAL